MRQYFWIFASATVGVAILAVAVYYIVYRTFVNRRIRGKSEKSTGLPSPKNVTTAVICLALAVLVFLGTYFSAWSKSAKATRGSFYHTAVSRCEETGDSYLGGFSKDENPGYTRYVKQDGEVTYTYFLSTEPFDAKHPSFLLFADYAGDGTVCGYRQKYSGGKADEAVGLSPAGGLLFAGTAPKASVYSLSLYFYEDGKAPAENDPEAAVAVSTFRLAIPE